MDDLLPLIHRLMKVAPLIGVMTLVATAPSPAVAASHQEQSSIRAGAVDPELMKAVACNADERRSSGRRTLYADDDNWIESDGSSPCMNLDGTPMNGDLGQHGNSVGDCGGSLGWGGCSSFTWE